MEMQDPASAVHGLANTKVGSSFWCPSVQASAEECVLTCPQRQKHTRWNILQRGLLQNLQIFEWIWRDIPVDLV